MSNKRDRATARAGRLSAANSAKRRLNPPCFFIDRNDVLWRRALLGGVAAAALLAGATEQAKASVPSSPKCGSNWTWDPITATLTCTHDQSGGINNPGGVTTIKNLVVKDLTKNIAPPSGTPGISLGNSGDATLYSSTGSFYISTAGDNASGISVGAFGDATIISAGQISTTGAHAHGITASSDAGSSSITSTGNISTQGDDSAGIYSTSHGNNTVTSTGGVTTLGDNSQGIYANASGGCSKCELTKGEDMLSELFAFDSKLTITSTGNIITAGNYSNAIEAHSSSSILITSTGNLTTSGDRASGIFARADRKSVV